MTQRGAARPWRRGGQSALTKHSTQHPALIAAKKKKREGRKIFSIFLIKGKERKRKKGEQDLKAERRKKGEGRKELPAGPAAHSKLPMQGTQVQPLVREPDPSRHN